MGCRILRGIRTMVRTWCAHTVVLAVPVVVAFLYCVATIAYNAPPSPLKVRVQPVLNAVMEPYFGQSWRLFAPDQLNGNYAGWFQVRYTDGARTVTTPVYALTDPLIAQAKANWPFPNRLDRMAISLGYQLTDITTSQDKARGLGPAASEAEKVLAHERAQTEAQLCRLVSVMTPGLLSNVPAREVRVFYTWTPITRFSDRYRSPTPAAPSTRIADTGWLSYCPLGAS